MIMQSLEGKVALVTGASSGIGAATASMLASMGARVALVARRLEKLHDLCEEIAAAGGEGRAFAADVGDEAQAFTVCEAVLAQFGQVDILVNNAGIIRPGGIAEGHCQDWRDTFDINLLAPMYMSKAVLGDMRARQCGHIVTVSSNAAKIPGSEGNNAYSASKYGITAFSAGLRKEVAAHGIRVTIVEPGTTSTEISESIADPALREAMSAHIGRETSMQAEDIAAAICYAVSQPARVNVDEIWLTPTRS